MGLMAISERDLQRIEVLSKVIALDSKQVEWKDVRASTSLAPLDEAFVIWKFGAKHGC